VVNQVAKHEFHGALPDAPQPLAPAGLLAVPGPPVGTYGILYPSVADFYLPRISSVEEIKHSTNSPKRRRFTFLVYNPLVFNPTKYVFELTNPKVTTATDLPTFI